MTRKLDLWPVAIAAVLITWMLRTPHDSAPTTWHDVWVTTVLIASVVAAVPIGLAVAAVVCIAFVLAVMFVLSP